MLHIHFGGPRYAFHGFCQMERQAWDLEFQVGIWIPQMPPVARKGLCCTLVFGTLLATFGELTGWRHYGSDLRWLLFVSAFALAFAAFVLLSWLCVCICFLNCAVCCCTCLGVCFCLALLFLVAFSSCSKALLSLLPLAVCPLLVDLR